MKISQPSRETVMLVVLILVALTSAMDVYTDIAHGASVSHMIKEMLVIVFAVILMTWILFEQHAQKKEIEELKRELANAAAQSPRMSDYVQGARKQLSEMIARQFDDWNLTASEKEVGWLLLKGLSLKEIALLRHTLEKTVRQQASGIYKKAGLNGRHAFAAWFIEDLF